MLDGYRYADLPGDLPPEGTVKDVDLNECQGFLSHALGNLSPEHLTADALWRDWTCFTPRVRTRSKPNEILRHWTDLTSRYPVEDLSISSGRLNGTSWVNVPFTFSTVQRTSLRAMCSGYASLVPGKKPREWKIWCLVTILEHFQGHENPDIPPSLKNKSAEQPSATQNRRAFEVVIIGAGQGGLSVAGRLAALNISHLLLEKESMVGSRWIRAYDSVRQHTVREANNLPFSSHVRTFEDFQDEVYLYGWQVASGYRKWVERYKINVWTSTETFAADYDESKPQWALKVLRDGKEENIICRHLVLAMGLRLSQPRYPSISNRHLYRGLTLHTNEYKNSSAWTGLRAIIIGSATNAHDVALDMVQAGLKSITIIQRNRTPVYPIAAQEPGQKALYNNFPTEMADRLSTRPTKIGGLLVHNGMKPVLDSEEVQRLYDDLETKGFRVDRTSMLFDLISGKAGSYYIDVGASQHIVSGVIKVKSGVPIRSFTETGLAFEDGTEIDADVVVFATGYEGDTRKQMAQIVGEDIANRFGQFGGLDEEGETRGAMVQGVPGLWVNGLATPQARFFSRFIALQIQAELLKRNASSHL